MIKAVSGKAMKKIGNHRNIELLTNERRRDYLVS